MTYTVGDKEYEDWTEAQDEAVRLLDDGVEPNNIFAFGKAA